MGKTISDTDVYSSCYRIVDSIYECIIEFNREEQTMCFKKLDEVFKNSFMLSTKISSDNIADFFVNTFIAEQSADEMRRLLEVVFQGSEVYTVIDFDYKSLNGEIIPCQGRIFCDECFCWLCFEPKRIKENAVKTSGETEIVVHTAGYFDLFVNRSAVLFRSKKAKKLLSLLVERKGGFLTSAEAVTLLWEDETVNQKTLSRYRKVAMRMHQTLSENGIEYIVENLDGNRRIVPEKIRYDNNMICWKR